MKLFKYHNINMGDVVPIDAIITIGRKEGSPYFIFTSPISKIKVYVDPVDFVSKIGPVVYRRLIMFRNKRFHTISVLSPIGSKND